MPTTTYTARAGSLAEALQIVGAVLGAMGDAKVREKLVKRVASVAVAHEQLDVWDEGLGTHSKGTVEARRRRIGYYGRNAPNERAQPDSPFLEWTGKLRASASTPTKISRSGGEVDADKAYRAAKGPIPGPAPFSEAVLSRVNPSRIWPIDRIEKRVERDVLEQWVAADVIPAARRRAR